jgi:hypothetical protein
VTQDNIKTKNPPLGDDTKEAGISMPGQRNGTIPKNFLKKKPELKKAPALKNG